MLKAMNIGLLSFIVFLISFSYVLILTFLNVVYNPSQEFKVTFVARIFVYITCITFLYLLYLNYFKYGGNYKYSHYSVILILYTFVPIVWSQLINIIILKSKTNEGIILNITIQFICSLIFVFKSSIFSPNNIHLLIIIALCLSIITYIKKKIAN